MSNTGSPCGSEPCYCLHPEQLPEGVLNGCDPIHHYFNLTYASYLVLPRTLLQSMPQDWQARFVALLREYRGRFDDHPDTYTVHLRDEHGRFIRDDLADYERGRRVVPGKDGSLPE